MKTKTKKVIASLFDREKYKSVIKVIIDLNGLFKFKEDKEKEQEWN